MSDSKAKRYSLPSGLTTRLAVLRRQTRVQKVIEAGGAMLAVAAAVFLLVFLLERLGDTPAALRGVLFAITSAAWTMIAAWVIWKWFWGLRHPEQVARLIARSFPSLGDQVLGVIELAQGRTGYAAPRLIEAALAQADEQAAKFDFLRARPRPRTRRGWIACLTLPLLVVGLAIVAPAATGNTLQRWALSWQQISRYTFTRIADLPNELVVPYAEPMEVTVSLAKNSKWVPKQAKAKYARRKLSAQVARERQYEFAIEKPTQASSLKIAVGDAREKISVRPVHRPELEAVEVEVELPGYLQRSEPLLRDVRTGRLTVVAGSRIVLRARANRELQSAEATGAEVRVAGQKIVSTPLLVDGAKKIVLTWKDVHGLAGKQAFELHVEPREDEVPVISWSGLHSGQVVLTDETVTFDVLAQDDFGIERIGMEWQAIGDPDGDSSEPPGERVLAVGSPEAEELPTVGTFNAEELKVPPGVVWVRVFASDFSAQHDPTYSSVISLQVMTPDQHSIWLNQQLRKWFARAEEVYKREQALHDVNRRLRSLPPEQLDRPETRQEIERQAAAEQANASRLEAVTQSGRELLKEASKNKEIGVGHLETLADALLKLDDLAQKKMPSVADLLQKAASAEKGEPSSKESQPAEKGDAAATPPSAEEVKKGTAGDSSKSSAKKLPSVNTYDSSEFENEKKDDSPPSKSSGRLTLPNNILQGGPKKDSQQAGTCPAGEELDEAVDQQQDLLEEFARIRDALQKLLINMEGSTFVKRLKAASKRQFDVAGELERFAVSTFGASDDEAEESAKAMRSVNAATFVRLADRERFESESMRKLENDLSAYYDRVQMAKIRPVLDEMEDAEAPRELLGLATTLKSLRSGDVLAEAEFWGETFDRWAEMLVDVASGGT